MNIQETQKIMRLTESNRYVMRAYDGTNFHSWSIDMQMLLVKEGLWEVMEESGAEADSKKQTAKLAKAFANICMAVSPMYKSMLMEKAYLNGKLAFDLLKQEYLKTAFVQRVHLRKKLMAMVLKEGQGLQAHMDALADLVSKLHDFGDETQEIDQVNYL